MEKVDGFLYDILAGQGDGKFDGNAASFLFKTEDSIISFLKCSDRMELEFPPLNSFYRRIVHCLGRRYALVHRVESTNIFNAASTLRKIYLGKPVGLDFVADGPLLKCSDWIPCEQAASELITLEDSMKVVDGIKKKKEKDGSKKPAANTPAAPKLKILKRASGPDSPVVETLVESTSQLSLEEREAKYQAARERIFEGFSADISTETAEVLNGTAVAEVSTAKSSEATKDIDTANSTEVDTKSVEDVSADDKETVGAESNKNSISDTLSTATNAMTLNPDAVPFSFTRSNIPVDATRMQINHVYVIKPLDPSNLLTAKDLQALLDTATSFSKTFKTRKIPTDFAFLLIGSNSAADDSILSLSCTVSISKWKVEEYLQ